MRDLRARQRGRRPARSARCAASSPRSPTSTASWRASPSDLAQLVDASAATFTAFASEDDRLRETLCRAAADAAPGDATLRDVRPFARELGPATRALTPAVRALDERQRRACAPFAREATPIVRDEIRPFARAARPLVRDLAPAATRPARDDPRARPRSGRVANRFFNMLASNPGGARGPGQGRPRGGLPVLAGLADPPDGQPPERRGRQRPDAPDLPDRHLRDARPRWSTTTRRRVRAEPLAAARRRSAATRTRCRPTSPS